MIYVNYGLISLVYFPLVGFAVFEPYRTPLLVVGGIASTMFYSWKLKTLRHEALDLKVSLEEIRSDVCKIKEEWKKEKKQRAT